MAGGIVGEAVVAYCAAEVRITQAMGYHRASPSGTGIVTGEYRIRG